MRAVLIKDGEGPVENLYIGEAPKPTLGNGEVLIKESLNDSYWKAYNFDLNSLIDTSIWPEQIGYFPKGRQVSSTGWIIYYPRSGIFRLDR